MTSTIEWLDGGDTWNPTLGCTPAGEGCRNCYAARQAARGLRREWKGLTHKVTDSRTGKPRDVFNGTVRLMEDRLEAPLHWKKPRRVFVDSMSDLFHDQVPDAFIDRVFAVMALCPQHQFIVLSKRAERMAGYLASAEMRIKDRARELRHSKTGMWVSQGDEPPLLKGYRWPLPNVVLGVSVSTQAEADAGVPWLLKTPAAYRIVSAEPLLGAVDLMRIDVETGEIKLNALRGARPAWASLDAVIVGGESGPGARPMHPDWARAIRDQCVAAGVAFFFKQWGEWAPDCVCQTKMAHPVVDRPGESFGVMFHCGKGRAGRLLDGRTWDEWVGK